MLSFKKEDYEAISACSAVLEKNKKLFQGTDKKTVMQFCEYAKGLEKRMEEDKRKHADAMKKYRTDPQTKEKAQAIDRRAQEKYQAKKRSVK